jgi:hypothetical protein
MKNVFDAANSIEAYMIRNLLEQAGVEARVEGEYLQGGVGELPAGGLVRVLVADQDVAAARSVIAEWDARQERMEPVPQSRGARGFGGFVLGVLAGTALVIWAYHTPVTEDGIDYDDNGTLDERHHYQGDRLHRVEQDRNLDGKTDFIQIYNLRGLIDYTRADDDFDGDFETKITYVRGNPVRKEADTNGDGMTDLRADYVDGVLAEVELFGPDGRTPRKRQRFDLGRLVSAEYDADADGRLDTRYEYDIFGEIARKTAAGNPADARPPAGIPLR